MMLLALHQVELQQGNSTYLYQNLNLQINAGECHCISGVTGCGKTTLLQLMAMPNQFNYQGEITHSDELIIGIIMQDPHVQLIRETIGAEVAFGLENLLVRPIDMLPLVEQALTKVGLVLPLNTPVDHLSLGQKYRLMLAAQLVFEPNLILIDEPWAQLDNQGITDLCKVLLDLLNTGVGVVIVEHNTYPFTQLINYQWQLISGTLIPANKEISSSEDFIENISRHSVSQHDIDKIPLTMTHPVKQGALSLGGRPCVLSMSGLTIQFANQNPLLHINNNVTMHSGDIVGLFGENGCGKTNLFNRIVGVSAGYKGQISLLGKTPKLGIFGANLGFLMQRPSRQLFEMTVQQELEFSLKRFGLPLSNATDILTQLNLMPLALHSPHKLSYGQQHLVAFASVLCINPKVLLLDDPFAGLDDNYFPLVIKALKHFSENGGAVIFSSHRHILSSLISKCWLIERQQLTEHCVLNGTS
ncbi:ATP-binding cassette domain-containing protein [Shewanella ulleungensis]|uniref:ABC transporter n=1 Tax=Shewanella ulleungensis TaxID=2282699 RepID=A0ABQ2QPI5_9GAMM|nr:ATP-binding cassette domain-containing protein [Shewanella ulleungensis]MCL1151477.1 ATP-binding cassette domain-containing protein [Shewanella ulleungensis]GGP91244.1 ABC transporter [Shewanella ulleungensis]